ncbi:hypothetical protein HH303_19075 [Rhodospirillaceae bacterium KN72]|uniref:PAS domain-containing protein n=1 Tax=Pacificispira spongiicola TaxID=2729598 RepID=A0A7Y0E3J3_9PROT|nr:PAS-domain containing protein [Pacificispira spongiicola]NMM46602.1 hypothetical protein [Pacificispira spongiicola]
MATATKLTETHDDAMAARSAELFIVHELLDEHRQMLDISLNAIPDGFAIVDRDGMILIANQALGRLLNLPACYSLDGMKLCAVMKDVGFRNIWDETCGPDLESAMQRRNGNGIAVCVLAGPERFLEINIGLFTETGYPITVRDVTKRVQSETSSPELDIWRKARSEHGRYAAPTAA